MATVIKLNKDTAFDYAGALAAVEPAVLRQFGRDASKLICWSANALLDAAREDRFDDIVKSAAPFHGLVQCFGAAPVVTCAQRLSDAAVARDGAAVVNRMDDLFQELTRFTPLLVAHARDAGTLQGLASVAA